MRVNYGGNRLFGGGAERDCLLVLRLYKVDRTFIPIAYVRIMFYAFLDYLLRLIYVGSECVQ